MVLAINEPVTIFYAKITEQIEDSIKKRISESFCKIESHKIFVLLHIPLNLCLKEHQVPCANDFKKKLSS